jgi:Domain of unknown function (DUF4326)
MTASLTIHNAEQVKTVLDYAADRVPQVSREILARRRARRRGAGRPAVTAPTPNKLVVTSLNPAQQDALQRLARTLPDQQPRGPQRLYWNRWSREPFPTGAKLISRGTGFGNPFKVPKPHTDADLDHVLHWHRRYLQGDPEAVRRARDDYRWKYHHLHGQALVQRIREKLAGHDVVCTGCPPGQRCHGDLILAVAAGAEP